MFRFPRVLSRRLPVPRELSTNPVYGLRPLQPNASFRKQSLFTHQNSVGSTVPSLQYQQKALYAVEAVNAEPKSLGKSKKKGKMSTEKFSKLPTYAKPTHYSIRLAPNLETFKCEGHETVTVNISEATNKLQLHSDEIEVKTINVKLADGTELKNLSHKIDKKWSWLEIDLGQELKPQEVKLDIDFVALHSDTLQGFYRSKYKNSKGEDAYMVSTQFESTYARKSFPCWDEPVYKATFDIELEVDANLVALSNQPIKSETESKPGKKLYKYEQTPIMSSYLIAFAVGEFEYIEEKAKTGTLVRIYTVPGKKEQGRFALDIACRALEWYEEWFAIPYPLPKCDLIAIPDFSMGAMENWGLVTYREVCLLIDQAKSSTRQKSNVALVVAHELAHFWFGNLVTMKWWTDLWLKEGFASFMEYLFISKNNPEFHIMLHFVNDELARGFQLDSLKSSHPIEVEIDNPNELDEIYDAITYAKSNSCNRMLFNYLGEERFREGLRLYLKEFKFSNAVTKDLWNSLGKASNENVDELMSTWTQQTGYPLIIAEEERKDGKLHLKLKQQRFLADGSTDETIWHVPVGICTASKPEEPVHKVLLTKKEDTFVLDNVAEGDWIKLNAGTTGFFQVQYNEPMLKALLPAVQNQKLNVLDRFGLTEDLFALVKAGKATPAQFLQLFAASANEEEYIVWGSLEGGLSYLSNSLARASDESLKTRFDQFVQKNLEPLAEKLGWDAKEGEDSQRSMLRGLILSRLAKSKHQKTIDTALTKFADHYTNKTELHPDLRAVIYGIAAREGGKDTLHQIQHIFETVGFSEVERNAIVAMGQVSCPNLLKEVFDYGVFKDKIRSQDLVALFAGCTAKPLNQDFLWEFFKANVPLLLKKFGSANSSLFQHCLKQSGQYQSSKQFAEQFEAFTKAAFDADQLKVLDRPIRQTVEAISINARFREHAESNVNEFLAKH